MPNTEALKRLDRLQTLIEKRPKFWTFHALAEIVRIRALMQEVKIGS